MEIFSRTKGQQNVNFFKNIFKRVEDHKCGIWRIFFIGIVFFFFFIMPPKIRGPTIVILKNYPRGYQGEISRNVLLRINRVTEMDTKTIIQNIFARGLRIKNVEYIPKEKGRHKNYFLRIFLQGLQNEFLKWRK